MLTVRSLAEAVSGSGRGAMYPLFVMGRIVVWQSLMDKFSMALVILPVKLVICMQDGAFKFSVYDSSLVK